MTINLITGIAAVVLGVVYTLMSYLMPRASFGDPSGHIVFPLIVGFIMTTLGLVLSVVELRKLPNAKASDKVTLPKTLSRYGKEIAFTIAASAVYALIFEHVGYVIATILYLGSILFLINQGKKSVATNVIVAVAFSVGVYALFAYVLGIQLPSMPFLDI